MQNYITKHKQRKSYGFCLSWVGDIGQCIYGRRQLSGRGQLPPVLHALSPAAPSRRDKKLYVPARPFLSIVST